MCFVLNSMLLLWIRHDLNIHLMNWELPGDIVSMNQGYFGICGNGTTNTSECAWIPTLRPLNYYWMMRSYVEPQALLTVAAALILLNQRCFFSILLNFFFPSPNMLAQHTLKWLNDSCSGVRPYHYIHRSDLQLWSHSLGVLSHHFTSPLKYHVLPNKWKAMGPFECIYLYWNFDKTNQPLGSILFCII